MSRPRCTNVFLGFLPLQNICYCKNFAASPHQLPFWRRFTNITRRPLTSLLVDVIVVTSCCSLLGCLVQECLFGIFRKKYCKLSIGTPLSFPTNIIYWEVPNGIVLVGVFGEDGLIFGVVNDVVDREQYSENLPIFVGNKQFKNNFWARLLLSTRAFQIASK